MKHEKRNFIIGGIIVALLIIGFFAFSQDSTATVSAQGYSEIKAVPDKVSIYVGIEGKGVTAQEAKDKHKLISLQVTNALIDKGFSEDDLKQTYFNVYPEYDWSNGQQKLKGYLAASQIVLETNDFDSVANVVDAVIDNGALISSINFELSNEKQSEYKKQALESASADARSKAAATAAGLGKKLGALVSVETSEFNYGPVPYYAKVEGGVASDTVNSEVRQVATNLAPQDISVSANVQVNYRIN